MAALDTDGYVCLVRDTRAIQSNQSEKPTAPPITITDEGSPLPPEEGEEPEEDNRECWFENREGFKCRAPDNLNGLRRCFGGVSGTAEKSTCQKDNGNPMWFHHMCYVTFYKEKKKKELAEEENCNRCPDCQAPKLKRSARGGA